MLSAFARDSFERGGQKIRRELRAMLKNYGLPIKGAPFDRIYQYVRKNC